MPNIEFIKLKEELNDYVIRNPTPAIFERPSWWKDMPKGINEHEYNFNNNKTIRSCPAINDAFNFGYILYTPVDIYIDVTDEENIFWKLPDINLSVHGDNQLATFFDYHDKKQTEKYIIDENYCKQVFKMNTLWGIKTDPGYSTWFTHPIGRNNLPFRIFDAIVDTDKFPAIFPYSFVVRKDFKGVIKSGTPFMQIIPFKRDDFSHTIVEKDIFSLQKKATSVSSFFGGGYKKLFWSRKKFL